MKVILQGTDWTRIEEINGIFIGQYKEEYENNGEVIEAENETVQEGDRRKNLFSLDYFERFFSLFGHEPSAFNLGLYQTIEKDEEIIKSTKYVGILPLLKKNKKDEVKKSEEDIFVVKISSRFGISPTDMIGAVLAGDDYYENPDMLKTKSYNESEWRNLAKKMDEDKVLFGLVNGIGYIDLFSGTNGADNASNTDVGLVDAYGVFEIIDFVNKAKEVCKKNLKKQSQRVEENLDCKVKGRILIQKQIKYNISKGQNQKTYCSYNKMSDDIKENQIIKYALYLCQKNHGIGDSLAEDIRFCMNTLSGVPLKKCSSADFVGLKNNGAFRQYKEALHAAKKVISRYSLSYSNQKSDDSSSMGTKAQLTSGKVLPYFIDMNLLFEYFCRAIFKKAIEEINKENIDKKIDFELESAKDAKRILFPVSSGYWNKHVIRENESDENDENYEESELHRFFMPQYIPDIVITYRTDDDDWPRVAAVFDAKYSDVEKKEKRSRTHQVLFYMKALDCNYGGLISPYMGEKGEKPVIENLAINHNISKGNPMEDKDSKMKLFYVPLISNEPTDENMFDRYVELAKKCLKEISDGLKIKLEQEQHHRELQSMITEEIIQSLKKKEDMVTYIKEIKCKIENMNSQNKNDWRNLQ